MELPSGPGWLVVAAVLAILASPQIPAIMKNLFGDEGAAAALWRWQRRREAREVEEAQAVEQTRAQYLQSVVADLRAELDASQERYQEELGALRRENGDLMTYVVLTTRWARQVVVQIESEGLHPAVEFRTFTQWCEGGWKGVE